MISTLFGMGLLIFYIFIIINLGYVFILYTHPANCVCGGYTVFTLSVCPSVTFWFFVRPKKYMCVSGSALKKLGMVCRHNILCCQNILYRNCIFQYIFPHFPANVTTFCSQFTIKCLGSGQKPRSGRET